MLEATASAPSDAFAAALGDAFSGPEPASLLGLEREYGLYRNGESLDFRRIIHDLPVPGQRLDPGDRNAYRCRSGLVATDEGAPGDETKMSPPWSRRRCTHPARVTVTPSSAARSSPQERSLSMQPVYG